jgi:hypothetical protein
MYLHIVELLSNISSTFALARREYQTPDNTQRNTDVSFSLHQPPHLSLQPQLLHSGRCRCQKGAPRVRRGRRRRRCEGVDDDDGGRADFAKAELADDAGDVAAAAVARVLARATIPAGEERGGGGGGGSTGASGWLSRRLTSCRRRLLSSWRSAASCLLTPPLPFASCTPPLPLLLVCQLVVALPLLSCRRRLCLATLPRPLLRHLVVATRNAPLVAPLLPLDL